MLVSQFCDQVLCSNYDIRFSQKVSIVIEPVNETPLNSDKKCERELEVVFLPVLVLVLEQTLILGKAAQSSDTSAARVVNQYLFITYSQGGLRAM